MQLALPTRPSITALPFANLSGETFADWISEVILERIISALSLSPDMLVMGRTKRFSNKSKHVSLRDAAKELAMRYILRGSMLQSGNKARITAELSDAVTGAQL